LRYAGDRISPLQGVSHRNILKMDITRIVYLIIIIIAAAFVVISADVGESPVADYRTLVLAYHDCTEGQTEPVTVVGRQTVCIIEL